MCSEDLVSIIMPTYNAERFVEDAIRSVMNQTYSNWEICITDDCSTDATKELVTRLSEEDSRIRFFALETNSGAAAARNNSLMHARGRFIAYLDADDLWYPEKLKTQVSFMKTSDLGFTCASYEVIAEDGTLLDKQIRMLERVDYKGFLTNNLLQTVGIMIDVSIVDKRLLIMPDLRRRQDAATWLQILKAGHICYGMQDVLCMYRRVNGSLSSDKMKAAKGVWYLYREVEQLPFHYSLYCFARYAVLAVWKRLYKK